MPATAIPDCWPADIIYLHHQHYAPSLSPAQRQHLRTPPSAQELAARDVVLVPRQQKQQKQQQKQTARIRLIAQPGHPACGQRGLFALRDLQPGELVVGYVGEVFGSGAGEDGQVGDGNGDGNGDGDKHDRSDYVLCLDRDRGIAVDAERMGGLGRFVNDYRGVPRTPSPAAAKPQPQLKPQPRGRIARCGPNAEFKLLWDEQRRERMMGVFVLGLGKSAVGKAGKAAGVIRKGDEILVSYGKGFWGARTIDNQVEQDED